MYRIVWVKGWGIIWGRDFKLSSIATMMIGRDVWLMSQYL